MQDDLSLLFVAISVGGWLGVALLLRWAFAGPRRRLVLVALILVAVFLVVLVLVGMSMSEAFRDGWWD